MEVKISPPIKLDLVMNLAILGIDEPLGAANNNSPLCQERSVLYNLVQ
jgi:hypothetical protein